MGSKIGRGDGIGGRLLWLNPRAIEAGHLTELAHPGKSPLHAVGVLLGGYLKIRLALELEGFEVRYFAYDWRADLESSARRLLAHLAAERADRCTLVAHSMGGLVARIALTLAPVSQIGRVIQLGTPNRGAYTPVQALRAVYPTVRKISALDPHRSAEDLAREIFLTLPGLYQMLPADVPPATIDLLDQRHWPADDLPASHTELARAREVRKLLAPAD
jgi:pimeloyl-ACP methyl ester carboxylesterase